MYQTSFSPGSVDVRELETMAQWLRTKTGKEVRVEQVIMVTTDSMDVSAMMDSLHDAVSNGKNGKPIKAGKRGRQPKTAEQEPEKMGPRFLRIESSGEILSKQAFNKRLSAGEVEELTNIVDAKGEQWVVIDRKLVKGPHS